MVQLLHTSDTHLGYRQYHLDERRQDFADAFAEVISAAIEEDVDAVVHAGDLFHTSRPGITPLQTVLTELQRLQTADIPFLLIVGNHERTHDRNWVELLAEIQLAIRLDSTGTQIDDTTIYGLDHIPPGQRDRLDYHFEPASTESAVLVGHGLFTPFGHGDWSTQRILEKSPVDFDLMLVGDDHGADYKLISKTSPDSDTTGSDGSTGNPSSQNRIPISYAGSTERTKADQRDPRTYSIVTVPPDGHVDPEDHIDRRVIKSAREFVYVDVPLRLGEGIDTVEQTIRQEVDSLDDAVLKVTLMAAEEGLPTPEAPTDGDDTEDGETTVPAVHERVPVGPIENLGAELGALVTRVSDRRDLLEDDREYQAVEFADVEAAVEKRREEITVTEAADQFLEMALNTGQVTDTGMADAAEERITELLEREPLSAFHLNNDDSDGSQTDSNDSDPEPVGADFSSIEDGDDEEMFDEALESLTD